MATHRRDSYIYIYYNNILKMATHRRDLYHIYILQQYLEDGYPHETKGKTYSSVDIRVTDKSIHLIINSFQNAYQETYLN